VAASSPNAPKVHQTKFLYSSITLARKYLQYWLTSSNGKGHGVHSPFVFDFIKNVLNDKKEKTCYAEIEAIRKQLLQNKNKIEVLDFGAGSTVEHTQNRIIANIAASSLKSPKYAQLIHRIAAYYHQKNIVELGTSLGVTAAYLAKSGEVSLVTFEGAPSISEIARRNFEKMGIKNVRIIEGNIDNTLPAFSKTAGKIDLGFIDGNHRQNPTLQYFQNLKDICHDHSILIFDDIHWSKEMEAAWELIKKDKEVTLSIDLFFIGLVFFRKDFKVKQHFTIRF
jgi:predicted O-methyltransferase YrrM